MIGVLLLEFVTLIIINKKRIGTIFNGFFFCVAPYVVIIVVNNLIMKNLGFVQISDNTIIIQIVTILLFYFGTITGYYIGNNYQYRRKKFELRDIDMSTLFGMTLICITIIGIDVLIHLKRYGFSLIAGGEEQYNRSSISAHLTLLLVTLTILNIDAFFEYHKKKYLIVFFIALGLIFLTFTKYHIISTVLACFIYLSIKRPQYIKIIGILTLGGIALMFIANYGIGFVASKVVGVPKTFYLEHMWLYISGGIINIDNATAYLRMGRFSNLSFGNWVIEMLTRFPSLLTEKIFGFTFTDYNFSLKMPYMSLGNGTSNVICIPGAALIQGGWICYIFFVLISGILVECLFAKALKTKSIKNLLIASIFLSYSMLSFFASFFELVAPWESMLWVILSIPLLHKHFVFGKIGSKNRSSAPKRHL